MTEQTPHGPAEPPRERDDLDQMLEEVAADPVARAVYEDAVQREELLDNLVEARGKRTQKAIAAVMGTTQSAISDIEKGRVDPRLSTLQRYARAVGKRLVMTLRGGGTTNTDDPPVDEPFLRVAVQLAEAAGLEGVLTDLFRKEPKVGPQSSAEVAESTGLPEPTVGYTMHRLRETGWLNPVFTSRSPEPQFSLRDDRGLMIGMSLGRRHVRAVLTNLRTTHLIAERERSFPETSPESLIRTVVDLVEELRGEAGAERDVVGLGVVLAGRIDGSTGTVYFAPDLQTDKHRWNDVPLEASLEEAVRAFGSNRVVVDNDANALGVFEYLLAGEEHQSVAVVLMSETGEGIGGGLVINDAIAHGTLGLSGEIGHIIVDPNGERCRCGARGCLETVASAASIVGRIKKATATPIESLEEASVLVQRGDPIATEAFTAAGEALGRVLLYVTAIVGSPRLVIFGPPQLVKEPDIGSAATFLDGVRRTHGQTFLGVKVDVSSKVLDHATLPRAAAATAVHHFLSRPTWWLPTIARPEVQRPMVQREPVGH
jgi:predicted NBD/HSP70 family sugar kinase/DNA-binding XRE family transcriptional regulator